MKVTDTILNSARIKLETTAGMCNRYYNEEDEIREGVKEYTEQSNIIESEVLGLLYTANSYGLISFTEVEETAYKLGELLSDKFVEFLKKIRGL